MNAEPIQYIKERFWNIQGILFIAFVLRAMWVWLPLGVLHGWNEAHYLRIAGHIARGGSYSDGLFDNPPLYTYVLTGIIKVFGQSTPIVRLSTVAFSLVTIYFVYKLGRLLVGKRVGLYSAAIFAFFPLNVFFGNIIHIDVFGVMLTTIALYLALIGCLRREKLGKTIFGKINMPLRRHAPFLLSGAMLGLAVMAKFPFGIAFIPIAYLLWKKNKLQGLLEIVISAALVQVPWYLYTYLTTPEFFSKTVSTSSSFFGIGWPGNPYYHMWMIILSWAFFILVLLYIWKTRPKSTIRKTLALLYLTFAGFFVLLPNHEYYLLPCFVPLFIDITMVIEQHKKRSGSWMLTKQLRNIMVAFLLISIVLVSIRPYYEIDTLEVAEYVDDSYPTNAGIIILSSTATQLRYYSDHEIERLDRVNIPTSGAVAVVTMNDRTSLPHRVEFIEENYQLAEQLNSKIWIYHTEDVARHNQP